jgi:putative ABC transport system permease protein
MIYSAWRNFIRTLPRYRVLLFALLIITMVFTAVLAVTLGLREGLYEKASRYFAGDLVVLGYTGEGDSLIEEPEKVREAIKSLDSHGIETKTYSRRSTYYDLHNIELFFMGYWMQQRRLVGVEWSLERPVLERFEFIAGDVPRDGDERGVLISSATADTLHIGVGDELLLSIQSDRGRSNTTELIVRGIFAESSFFGYTSYIQRGTLNQLREAPEETVNEMGVYLKHSIRDEDVAAEALYRELRASLPTFGIIQSREEYSNPSQLQREQREYGIVTVGAQLDEINDLLKAVTIIAGVIILMFLAIVVVGVSNTFTMVVWERRREIGTLRALGMQRYRMLLSFLLESAFLGLIGLSGGFLLGIASLEALRQLVSFPPTFISALFLTQGRLQWLMPGWGFPLIAALVLGSSLFGSFRAAFRAGKMSPLDALSHRN